MYIDTHAHLDFSDFDSDRLDVIRRALERDVKYIINVGSDLDASKRAVELCKKNDFVYASVGVHPHDANSFDASSLAELKVLASNDKVVAIGETGLDFYRNLSNPKKQEEAFIAQVNLSKELNLPLVIHSRSAQEETISLLKKYMPLRAVVHCFAGGKDFLDKCLDLGFYVSFTCNITYKKAQDLRDLVKFCPLERMFLETDAPYLSPEGLRGKRNEPANVVYVAEEIAKIKGVGPEEVGEITTRQAKNFFGIKG
ncbi:MAG: TatD family hydrolase [Candidatus Omnitrophica bacterium]|jgi:TatD DNase family protein|nr:TatD family hydrolase [Candidatus Omnitrophota bacterium]